MEERNIFIRWRLAALILMQIAAIVAWNNPNPITVAIMLLVWTTLGWLHFRCKKIFRYCAFATVIGLMLFAHQQNLGRLSDAVTTKKASYAAHTISLATMRDKRATVVIDLDERLSPAKTSAWGRIQLTVDSPCLITHPSHLKFTAAIKEPRAYKNPGTFNYREHLRRENIWGQAFVKNCKDIVVTPIKAWPWQHFRQSLATRLAKTDLANGPAMAALLLGSRSVGREDETLIRNAGLSHLFAISGMQFAVMTALIFGLVSLITRLFPQIYLKWPRQKIASLATLIFIATYLGIVVPQPSIIRAGFMIGAYLLAVILEKQKHLLYVILSSMAGLLLVRPMDIFHISFQLSYLCVLILALIIDPLVKFLETKNWYTSLPKTLVYAFNIILVSWILNLLLLPLIFFDFGEANFSGLIHNLWAIPYFDFIVTPLSLAYFELSMLSFSLSDWILPLWDGSLTLFLKILNAVSTAKKTISSAPTPHLIHVIIFYAGALIIALTRRKSILGLTLALLTLTILYTYYQNHLAYDFRLTQIDVGQGDATLIETKDKSILVDAGGSPYFDLGKNVIAPFLRHKWMRSIDVGVITHADIDHYLGFTGLIETFDFGEIWVNDLPEKDETYKKLLSQIREKGIPVRIMNAGTTIELDDKTQLSVLSPGVEQSELPDDNDRSLVLKIEHGGFTTLLTGDISARAEKILLATYGDRLDSDLLKISHHGSRSSSSESFLRAVSPNWAIIGVAEHSHFGHPHHEVLKRLEVLKTKTYRTDLDGAVEWTVKNASIHVQALR